MNIHVNTSSGHILDLTNLPVTRPPRTVFTRALSMVNRYAGQTIRPYPVSEHSVNLAEHPEVIAAGLSRTTLLHDFSEALMNDIIRPVKVMLPEYTRLEEVVLRHIFMWWDEPFENLAAFAEFDSRICADEMQALFIDPPPPWTTPLGDINIPIAEISWMTQFRRFEGACNRFKVKQ